MFRANLAKFSPQLFSLMLALFSWQAPVASASAIDINDLSCQTYLGAKSIEREPLQAMVEHWPAFVSKFKPVYKTDEFDVRILSDRIGDNTFSPKKLKEVAIESVSKFLGFYKSIGIEPQYYSQVIVEANPGSVWTEKWGHKSVPPFVGYYGLVINHKDVLGLTTQFVGKRRAQGFSNRPTAVVLTALTPSDHTLEDPFLVAHELAHITQNVDAINDLIWLEARADFLAYLATGRAILKLPKGVRTVHYRADGSRFYAENLILRNIKNPLVRTVSKAVPIDADHHNSQIISSALYEISNHIGREEAIHFVQWMDQVVPVLFAKSNNDVLLIEKAFDRAYVDNQDQVTCRLRRLGWYMRLWGRDILNDSQKKALDNILRERELIN